MAAAGEIETPDCAIFADTQSEPGSVYRWLDYLIPLLPFPVHIVSAGSLRDEILAAAAAGNMSCGRPPFFIRNPDGSKGIVRRQCTRDFKIDVILRKQRELIGLQPRQRGPREPMIESWIGISLDEKQRMSESMHAYIRKRFPLIERRMNRWDCLEWIRRAGHPRPPKSACFFCPFRRDAEWREMRDNEPADFIAACDLDRALRAGVIAGLDGEPFVHDSLVPLSEVDLSTPADYGQLDLLHPMQMECAGVCGV
ncbi:hypothetical protein [Hydrocarboniphaga effusa]|uniref:hypothetical protein n=1 Tax=Hydrocarboniphaga effusa TaxID=243629 RepID=UPI003BACEBE9